MRADVSVKCRSNSAELKATGVGHLDVKSCPLSCLSADPSGPLCGNGYCCLPEVCGGRQLSKHLLFDSKTRSIHFDCALIRFFGCRKRSFALKVFFCRLNDNKIKGRVHFILQSSLHKLR